MNPALVLDVKAGDAPALQEKRHPWWMPRRQFATRQGRRKFSRENARERRQQLKRATKRMLWFRNRPGDPKPGTRKAEREIRRRLAARRQEVANG